MRLARCTIFLFLSNVVALAADNVAVVYPTEQMKLPNMAQTFVYGNVPPGSVLRIQGSTVPVHSLGGFIAFTPITPGENKLQFVAQLPSSTTTLTTERTVTVTTPWTPLPTNPARIEKWSIEPKDDIALQPGDSFRISFLGASQGLATYSVGNQKQIPMGEQGGMRVLGSTAPISGSGSYQAMFTIPADWAPGDYKMSVALKQGSQFVEERLKTKLTVLSLNRIKMGLITEEMVALRIAPEGGYDLFLYRGMRVRLIGKIGKEWKVRLASNQVGWVKESAIQELIPGVIPPQSVLANMSIVSQPERSLVKIPLTDMLPFRVEQSNDPMALTVTVYGAVNRTDLIRYDVNDPLVEFVRWRQTAPDVCQVQIMPKFKTWWGADVRYENNTLVIEIRKPWGSKEIKNLPIAIDAGHGGNDPGAMGPRQLLEKDANLMMAKAVASTLQKAGARPILIRETDTEVALHERPRIAFRNGAQLFISFHSNASPPQGNPIDNNGYSIYWNQPQSLALAKAIHRHYGKRLGLKDQGLFYADFAVCRPLYMPAVLTENAFIIVPEQEALLFDPVFHQKIASAIVAAIQDYLKQVVPGK